MTTFKINKERDDSSTPTVSVYTFYGEQDRLDELGFPVLDMEYEDDIFEEPDAYAIKITKGKKTNYYVKRGKYVNFSILLVCIQREESISKCDMLEGQNGD